MPILSKIFEENPQSRVLFFYSSKLKVKNLTRELRGRNIKIEEMHSDLDQNRRDDVMLDFKAGKVQVIVATDILARGIDIDDIEMVINYDVPREAEDYVHRIGRTARANRDGRAITFVARDEAFRLKRIEKLLEKEIPREEIPAEFGPSPQIEEFSSEKGGRRNGRQKAGKKFSSSHKKYFSKKSESPEEKSVNNNSDNFTNQINPEEKKPKGRRNWKRRRKTNNEPKEGTVQI